jgi:hypothetical protein
MKNLSSQVEGVWIESLQASEAQIETLQNGTNEEKKAVITALKGTPSNADIAKANEVYNLHKPQDDNYSLIACDLTIQGEEVSGIINCRINGEHQQIRF